MCCCERWALSVWVCANNITHLSTATLGKNPPTIVNRHKTLTFSVKAEANSLKVKRFKVFTGHGK